MSVQSIRKNILYLSVYDPHVPLTGAGTRGMKFVENLAKFFEIDLIYLEGSGQKPNDNISQKYQFNLPDVRSKTKVKFSPIEYFLFSQTLYHEALTKLKKHHYDWLLCDYGLSAIYGSLLSKKFQIPFVYCSHNIEYLIYWDKGKTVPLRWLLLPYVYCVERLGVKHSDLLVAISQSDANSYKQYHINQDKVLVIPQGFDSSTFHPFYQPPQNNPKVILFCGNYGIQQNREAITIVQVYPQAPALVAPQRLIENERAREKCIALVQENGGEQFFKTKGWQQLLQQTVNQVSGAEQWERQEERRDRYHNDLLEAKSQIENRLPGLQVRAFAPPWGAMHSDLSAIVQSTGHELLVLADPLPELNGQNHLPIYPRLKGNAIWILLQGPILGIIAWFKANQRSKERLANGAIP